LIQFVIFVEAAGTGSAPRATQMRQHRLRMSGDAIICCDSRHSISFCFPLEIVSSFGDETEKTGSMMSQKIT
jgi:hypothetical protein